MSVSSLTTPPPECTIAMVTRIRFAEIIGGNVPEYTPIVLEYTDKAITAPEEWWHVFMVKHNISLEVRSSDYARVNIQYDNEEFCLAPGATIIAYSDLSVGIVTRGNVVVVDSHTYNVNC